MDIKQRFGDEEEMLRTAIAAALANVWTALPAQVVSFDPDAVTVVVQPTIKATVTGHDGSTAEVALPVLPDVPVVFPRGGGCTLTFPVQAGDECLVVFAARSIDGWWQLGGVQQQTDARSHDLSDGFAILGPQSQAKKIAGISTNSTQLRSDDASTYIELDPVGQVLKFVAPGGCQFITPEATFSGKVTAAQDVKSTGGDVLAGTVSLKNHLTTGVTPGSGLSNKPQQ